MSENPADTSVAFIKPSESEKKETNSNRVGTLFIRSLTCGICPKTKKKLGEPVKMKMKKNKNVQGTVEFDKATNIEMYRNILDNSLIGTKLVSKGVICSLTPPKIIACNPTDFTPTVEQISFILSGFENIDLLKAQGFMIVTDCYEPTNFYAEQLYARNKDCTEEVLILQTNTTLMIAITPNPVESIKELMVDIRDSLKNQGL